MRKRYQACRIRNRTSGERRYGEEDQDGMAEGADGREAAEAGFETVRRDQVTRE
jgi:hypothetical protein